MALIKVFSEETTNFETDGDYNIFPISSLITEEKNNDFYIEVQLSYDDSSKLKKNDIIAALYKLPTHDTASWQGFRITNKEVQGDTVYYTGWHVSYDAYNVLIKDLFLDTVPFNDALSKISTALTDKTNITMSTKKTTNVVLDIHYNSLGEVIYALVDNYNCDIIRDNFNVTFVNDISEDKGATYERGKNISYVNKYENTDDLVTKLYPTMVVNDVEYTIDEEYVEDDIYPVKYVKHKEFYAMHPDYYQSLIDEINDFEKQIEDALNQNENYNSNIAGLREDIGETEEELAEVEKEYNDLEKYYKSKLQNSESYRKQLYNSMQSSINAGISTIDKQKKALNKTRDKYKSSLNSKKSELDEKNKLYRDYSKKKLKNKAKSVKKQIDSLKKQIKQLESQIKDVNKKLTTLDSSKKQLTDYKNKYNSADKMANSDIKSIVKILKNLGLNECDNIANEYAKATESISDKKEYERKMHDTMQKILKYQEDIEKKEKDINSYQNLIAANEELISTNTDQIKVTNDLLVADIKQDLKNQAEMHLKKYKVPQVSYEVDVIESNASIGDIVQVKESVLGLDILTEVMRIVYNTNTQTVNTIEFGNTNMSMRAMRKQMQQETENQIAQTKVLLENSYSNMMSQIEGIQGYVCGMSTLQQEDGEMTEINTLLHVAQAEISSKVSERTAYEYIETTIDQKADSIVLEAREGINTGGTNLFLKSDLGFLDDLHIIDSGVETQSTDDDGWRKFALTKQLNNVDICNSDENENNVISLISGEQYVFSILCKTDGTFECEMDLYNGVSGHREMPTSIYKVNDTTYKIECKFTEPTGLGRRFVYLTNFTTVGATYLKFRYPCLKQGNTSSEYAPSPYDYVTPKEVVSSINLTPSEIKISSQHIDLVGAVTAECIDVTDLNALGATIAGWEIKDRFIQKVSKIDGDDGIKACLTTIESPTKSSDWFLWSKIGNLYSNGDFSTIYSPWYVRADGYMKFSDETGFNSVTIDSGKLIIVSGKEDTFKDTLSFQAGQFKITQDSYFGDMEFVVSDKACYYKNNLNKKAFWVANYEVGSEPCLQANYMYSANGFWMNSNAGQLMSELDGHGIYKSGNSVIVTGKWVQLHGWNGGSINVTYSGSAFYPEETAGIDIGRSNGKFGHGYFSNGVDTTSDEKQKDIIGPISKEFAEKYLRGQDMLFYTYKPGNGHSGKRIQMGTTVQRSKKVSDELGYDLAMYQGHIIQDDGSDDLPYHGEELPDEKIRWTINNSHFFGPVIVSIQDFYERFEKQEERIQKLEAEVSELKELVKNLINREEMK